MMWSGVNMTIESLPPINQVQQTEAGKVLDTQIAPVSASNSTNALLDTDIKLALDNATGLIQSIVSDKISDKVIRKMPTDEYLNLLSLLDEIITGSINKHV